MSINIKNVRKNAAKLYVNSLILFFEIAAVLIILTLFVLGGFMHLNLQKSPWPIVVLVIDVFGAFTIVPIVYLIARNSKTIQIKYVNDIIESKKNLANTIRSYSEDYSKVIHKFADLKFSELTKNSSNAIDYDVEQYKVVESDTNKELDLTWKDVKKKIDETIDKDTQDDMYESYIDYKAEVLEQLKVIKKLYEQKKYNTIDDFQKKVDEYMYTREKMIANKSERNEAYAKEQETIAEDWVNFLKNNY